ncbi:MAG: lmo0937 family membrane protein [Gammaproteobacteria bacterium]|nr:lmo0937 family membrane protein [Gammaproteobacteria bacterium]
MWWTIFVILLVLWLAGLVTAHTVAGLIHILLVLVLALLVVGLVRGHA